MKIYAITVVTFSSDIHSEEYIDSYWLTQERAEEHILKENLFEKSYEGNNVHISPIEVKE